MLTSQEYELLISSISHEIRNPVTLINSYLQLMEQAHPEVSEFTHWRPIQHEMQYLCRLLGDISAFQSGEHLHLTFTDSKQWLSEYADSARMLIHRIGSSHTTFTIHLYHSLPFLSMDQTKIRQVLDNLIRNSIEAASGTNTITLSASSQGQNLLIQVSDTGCGIPKEDLSSIFRPFVTHKPQGTGLGLAIAKRIAQAHKGDLFVRSVPGQGSVFTLRLPIH